MAVQEKGFWVFYYARFQTEPRVCPPHTVGITQMSGPWRVGKAVVFPWFKGPSLVIGLWKKANRDVDELYEDDQWIVGQVLEYGPGEISTWWNGVEDEKVAPVVEAEESFEGAPAGIQD